MADKKDKKDQQDDGGEGGEGGEGEDAGESEGVGFKFWRTQPVPRMGENLENLKAEEIGPLEEKKVEDIRTEPYALPDGFVWSDVDVGNDDELSELYKFLNLNYVEDTDNTFRFDYSKEFLVWALTPPEQPPHYHVGVRAAKSGKLFGFISAVPAAMFVAPATPSLPLVEINFLCVHKKLREKRVAPMLIREITRRVNLNNVWQAVYTAGVVLPKPVASCRYWHRNLNPKKLIETNFTRLQPRQTMARVIKLYKLPEEPLTPHLEPMTEATVDSAMALLVGYLAKFKLHPVYTREDFVHWFMPREGVISTYVVKNPETHKVTDLISFYTLPSSVINHPKHSSIKVAYAYYNVATTVTFGALMKDALILANKDGHDVFNALDLMDNGQVLDELKFGRGDGCLHYYLYNWRAPSMQSHENGLVML